MPTRTNFLIGPESTQWRRDLPNYARVTVEQLYRGIDAVYYGSGQHLEYDLKVAPGANSKVIRIRVAGARRIRIDDTGDLLIDTPAGTLRHCRPKPFREIKGARKDIPARYVLDCRRDIGFVVGEYDKGLPLIIDPVLRYSTYFGSLSGGEFVHAIALDDEGSAHIVGQTVSRDLPTTPGALQPSNNSPGTDNDVFIAKLNSTGTAALYVTYLGGSSFDNGTSIDVDAQGNAFVTGRTSSTDFPTTANAFQRNSLGIF